MIKASRLRYAGCKPTRRTSRAHCAAKIVLDADQPKEDIRKEPTSYITDLRKLVWQE